MARSTKAVQFTSILRADTNGRFPDELEVVHTGDWHTPWHGDFEITEADIDEGISHFNAGVYRVNGTEPLPGTLDHLGGGSPAAFRIERVFRDVDRMKASVKWTKLGEEKLERDEYRYVSFEFFPRSMPFENPEKAGETLVNVLTGATLTNDPLFKKLKPVMASTDAGNSDTSNGTQGGDMNLEAILAKKAGERTDEEKSFLAQHKAELTDEQRKEAGLDETPAPSPAPAEAPKEEPKPAAPEAPQPAGPVEASANGGLSASAIKQLQADAAAGRAAQQELLRTRLTASVKAAHARGAIVSDQINPTVELLASVDDSVRTKLESFIGNLPTNSLLAAEAGSSRAVETAIEVTPEEKALAGQFGNTPEDIEAFKKSQAEQK